jgi:hypothetical protein
MDSKNLDRQRALGKDLRRHLCSVVALGYRYQSGAWVSSAAKRSFHTQAIRDLNRAVSILTRLITECGVSLPGSATEIERHTYIEVDQGQMCYQHQALAESRLQQALRHTNGLASRSERSDIAEAVFALCRDSQERVKRLQSIQGKPVAPHPPGTIPAFV